MANINRKIKNKSIIIFLLLITAGHFSSATAEEIPKIKYEDKVLIKEAYRLLHETGDAVWKGWTDIALPVNFIEDDYEYLIKHPKPSEDFILIEKDPVLETSIYGRKRQMSPQIAAAFPVCGVPSALIGTKKNIGLTSTSWVITLIHEWFHVYQQNNGQYEKVMKLNLGSQTDASWMLNYPFPYEDQSVRAATGQMGYALYLCSQNPDDLKFHLKAYLDSRHVFRELLKVKSEKDDNYAYAKFQEWIEGNIAYAEKLFPHITSPQGLLIIGMKKDLSPTQASKLSRFNINNRGRLKVTAFDELLEQGKQYLENLYAK